MLDRFLEIAVQTVIMGLLVGVPAVIGAYIYRTLTKASDKLLTAVPEEEDPVIRAIREEADMEIAHKKSGRDAQP